MSEDEAYAMCCAYEESEREFADFARMYEQERDEAKARLDDLRAMLWTNFGILVDNDGDGWRVVAARKDMLDRQSVYELERKYERLQEIAKRLYGLGDYKCTLTYCGDCGYNRDAGCGLYDMGYELRKMGIDVNDI